MSLSIWLEFFKVMGEWLFWFFVYFLISIPVFIAIAIMYKKNNRNIKDDILN